MSYRLPLASDADAVPTSDAVGRAVEQLRCDGLLPMTIRRDDALLERIATTTLRTAAPGALYRSTTRRAHLEWENPRASASAAVTALGRAAVDSGSLPGLDVERLAADAAAEPTVSSTGACSTPQFQALTEHLEKVSSLSWDFHDEAGQLLFVTVGSGEPVDTE